MGLVISQRLAELMNGRMWVESASDIGSKFYFTIQVKNGVSDPQFSDAFSQSRLNRPKIDPLVVLGEDHPLEILLVEDNRVNQRVTVTLLKSIGYVPDIATNGLEAVEMASNKAYDLIFMDIHMPEMDGVEATLKIKSNQAHGSPPKIYAITASVSTEDRARSLAAGMDGIIHKPVKANMFSQVIVNVIKGHVIQKN